MTTTNVNEPKVKKPKPAEAAPPVKWVTAEEAAGPLPIVKDDPRIKELTERHRKLGTDRQEVARKIAELSAKGQTGTLTGIKAHQLATGQQPDDSATSGKLLADLHEERRTLEMALDQLGSMTTQAMNAVASENGKAAYEASKPLLRRQALAVLELAAATLEVIKYRNLIARKGLNGNGMPALAPNHVVFNAQFIAPGEPYLSNMARDFARKAGQLELLTPEEAEEWLARFFRV